MKKRVLSGIQSSGKLTIGNYLGSIKNWKKMIDEKDCFFMIADLHTLTVRKTPEELRENKKNLISIYLASGLDPKKVHLFMQSDVAAHAELSWILSCFTYFGELSRMTQFKDKSAKHADNINAGLFTYPVLMAADILLYDADEVPVGEDQLQHIEIARDIAKRFNNIYGETFRMPRGDMIPTLRIMGLQDPNSKMSKSTENPMDSIYMLDTPEEIEKKVKRAVTDSDGKIYIDRENKPGIYNLLLIYSEFKDIKIEEAERHFKDKTYKEFKEEVAKSIIDVLEPIRQRFLEIKKDDKYIKSVLEEGKKAAEEIANKKLDEVYKKIGIKLD